MTKNVSVLLLLLFGLMLISGSVFIGSTGLLTVTVKKAFAQCDELDPNCCDQMDPNCFGGPTGIPGGPTGIPGGPTGIPGGPTGIPDGCHPGSGPVSPTGEPLGCPPPPVIVGGHPLGEICKSNPEYDASHRPIIYKWSGHGCKGFVGSAPLAGCVAGSASFPCQPYSSGSIGAWQMAHHAPGDYPPCIGVFENVPPVPYSICQTVKGAAIRNPPPPSSGRVIIPPPFGHIQKGGLIDWALSKNLLNNPCFWLKNGECPNLNAPDQVFVNDLSPQPSSDLPGAWECFPFGPAGTCDPTEAAKMIEIWKAFGLCGVDIYSFLKDCRGWYIAPIPAGPAGVIPFPLPTECELPTDVPCEELINQIIDAYHHAIPIGPTHSSLIPIQPSVPTGRGSSSGPSVSHTGRH